MEQKFSPTVIAIEQCNMRCTYCFYNQADSYSSEKINFDALTGFLLGIEDKLSEQVLITGGEPFLWQDLPKFLRFLSAMGKKALLNSNLAARVDAELLAKHGAKVETSLDGYDAITNSIRGNELLFARTLENIAHLIDAGVPVGVTCVVTSQNYAYVEKLADFFKSLQASRIAFQPIYITDKKLQELSLHNLSRKDTNVLMEKLISLAQTPGMKHRMDIMRAYYVDGVVTDERCRMGQKIFVVEPRGNVYPCFYRYDLSAGNINRNKPKEIFENLLNQAEKIRTKDCFRDTCVCHF